MVSESLLRKEFMIRPNRINYLVLVTAHDHELILFCLILLKVKVYIYKFLMKFPYLSQNEVEMDDATECYKHKGSSFY